MSRRSSLRRSTASSATAVADGNGSPAMTMWLRSWQKTIASGTARSSTPLRTIWGRANPAEPKGKHQDLLRAVIADCRSYTAELAGQTGDRPAGPGGRCPAGPVPGRPAPADQPRPAVAVDLPSRGRDP